MSWLAIVSTATGINHIRSSKPCQDSASYKVADEQTIIGVVSDGMGSARYADDGSNLTVNTVVSRLTSIDWQAEPISQEVFKREFETIVKLVNSELEEKAKICKAPIDDFACTLLAFVATPYWLAAMQIGDGMIVTRSKNGNYSLLFQPVKGEFANETESVTSRNALQELKIYFENIQCEFICAATDGIENISLNKQEPKHWQPYNKFFNPLEQHMLSEISLIQKEKDLEMFLKSDRINSYTTDDKTLLLCIYQKELAYQNKNYNYSNNKDLNDPSHNSVAIKSSISFTERNHDFDTHGIEQSEINNRYLIQEEEILDKISENYTRDLIAPKINNMYFSLKKIVRKEEKIEVHLRLEKIFLFKLDRKILYQTKRNIKMRVSQLTNKETENVKLIIECNGIRKMLQKFFLYDHIFINISIAIAITAIITLLILY